MHAEQARRRSAAENLALWREFAETGDTRVRDRLILRLTPIVRYIATRQIKRLPAHLTLDDFVSCGFEALIRSIDRFDPERGTTLEQFAWTRIHGAMLDELRQSDWAPRSLRRWERETEQKRQKLAAENGRPPSRDELAAAIGISRDEYDTRRAELARAEIASLNRQLESDDDSQIEVLDAIESDDRDSDPEDVATRRIAYGKLADAIAQLSPRDQKVVIMRYVEGLPLREIGDALSLTESRVCQLLGAARNNLRAQLAGDAECMLAAA